MLVTHGWLHGGYPQTGMQSPIESEFKIPSLNLDTIKQQQKQTYRLRNVRAGYYVLYRALVISVNDLHRLRSKVSGLSGTTRCLR